MKRFLLCAALLASPCSHLAAEGLFLCVTQDGRRELSDRVRDDCKKLDAPRPPAASDSAKMYISKGSNGHFEVDGRVNDVAVHFIIDTGATMVSVSDHVATEGRLSGGKPIMMRTANGIRNGQLIDNVKVSIGFLPAVRTTVITGLAVGRPKLGLLGQAFLANYDIQIQGDLMVIARRPG